MLVLTLKENERITIGDDIELVLIGVESSSKSRLGVVAPVDQKILRSSLRSDVTRGDYVIHPRDEGGRFVWEHKDCRSRLGDGRWGVAEGYADAFRQIDNLEDELNRHLGPMAHDPSAVLQQSPATGKTTDEAIADGSPF